MKINNLVYIQHHLYDYISIESYASIKRVPIDFVIEMISSSRIEAIAVGMDATLMINLPKYADFKFHWWQKGKTGMLILLTKQFLGITNGRVNVMWQDMPFDKNY